MATVSGRNVKEGKMKEGGGGRRVTPTQGGIHRSPSVAPSSPS